MHELNQIKELERESEGQEGSMHALHHTTALTKPTYTHKVCTKPRHNTICLNLHTPRRHVCPTAVAASRKTVWITSRTASSKKTSASATPSTGPPPDSPSSCSWSCSYSSEYASSVGFDCSFSPWNTSISLKFRGTVREVIHTVYWTVPFFALFLRTEDRGFDPLNLHPYLPRRLTIGGWPHWWSLSYHT
jgi:hypothetical protein